MTAYAWKGRNGRGEALSGVLDGHDENEVVDQLFAGGITPIEVNVAAEAVPLALPAWVLALTEPGVKDVDTLVFTRQMYSLERSGVPILRSLAGLEASTEKPAMAAVLADVRASLNQGKDLSTALSRHPKVFDTFYVAMARVGEMTGNLAEIFLRLSEHIEFEMDTRARIKQALRYPTLVAVSIGLAIALINIFVIPTFAAVFANFHAELPLMTRLLLGVSDFMVQFWPYIVVALAGMVIGVRQYVQTEAGRYRWDKQKLRLPIIGIIILKATLSRFARSFALASGAGVPISQTLTVVALTVDNAFIGQRIEQMRDGVERGESISRCAAATGIFTPIVLQMLAVGEESGELERLLNEVGHMYDRETNYAIKGLSASIEPILLTLVAGMVLVLALGVFLPLWNLGKAAMGRG